MCTENNSVTICGEIISEFEFNHEVYEESFYLTYIRVERTSENADTIPVMVSDRLINVHEDLRGADVRIFGQYRSYNVHDEGTHLFLYVFAKEVELLSEPINDNEIFLEGYVCKYPSYRRTPLGREITDVLLAVNRSYGKSDYIPCICWGRNARYAAGFEVGEKVDLTGRIQSRNYTKHLPGDIVENRMAYEVSVSNIKES